jgi:hypothetical protein
MGIPYQMKSLVGLLTTGIFQFIHLHFGNKRTYQSQYAERLAQNNKVRGQQMDCTLRNEFKNEKLYTPRF